MTNDLLQSAEDASSPTFSEVVNWKLLNYVPLFVTLWIVTHQTPLSLGFLGKNNGAGSHSFSMGSSQPKDGTWVSQHGRQILFHLSYQESPQWALSEVDPYDLGQIPVRAASLSHLFACNRPNPGRRPRPNIKKEIRFCHHSPCYNLPLLNLLRTSHPWSLNIHIGLVKFIITFVLQRKAHEDFTLGRIL